MPPEFEVVITGTGAVSPIGIGNEAVWDSLLAGRSGIAYLREYDAPDYPVTFGAEIKGFDGKQFVKPRKAMKVMCREIQTGFAAAALAMEHAGLEPGSIDPDRLGVVYGSDMMYSDFGDLQAAYQQCIEEGWYQHDRWGPSAMSETNPLWMLKYLPNMPACHVAIYFDGRGHNNTICLWDVSGLLAVAEAASHVRRGTVDCIIAGGTGSWLNINILLYRGDYRLSHRNDAPEKASRPFDKDRDGVVNGEAAASLILEPRGKAEARGANILGSIRGFGSGFGPVSEEQPAPVSGIRGAIRAALQDAGVTPSDLAMVSAHGISREIDDALEAKALAAELPGVPVTGLKSYYGNCGSGGGALDTVACLLSLGQGLIPPTLNYETPDPLCDLPIVHGEMQPTDKSLAMLINYSRMGQCAALIVEANRA